MNTKYTESLMKIGGGVLALLILFLATKTITEIISWSQNELYPTKTITISAEGESLAVADIASFTFSVSEEGTTSGEAQKKSTDKINKAIEYLKSNQIDEKDIKTENYSIYPKYSNVVPCYTFNCPPVEQKIIGYIVSQSVRVKIRNTEDPGKYLSELTNFEINNISGITFTIDDEDALYDQARKDAINKTKIKAEILAKELDVRLGDVISFNEENPRLYSNGYGAGGAEMMTFAKSDSPDIPRGENTYTTRVYVTYELK